MAQHLIVFTLFHLAFTLIMLPIAHAHEDQSGSISIDCGLDYSGYSDETTGIHYVSDEKLIDTGTSMKISSAFKTTGLEQQFWNVRSFPDGTKNCYTLRPSNGRGNKYLIRAGFMYGDYDSKDLIPEFDLFVGVNLWDSVKLKSTSSVLNKEIIYIPPSDYVYVCVVNIGLGTPFISVLELRLLNNETYETESGSLELLSRGDCNLAEDKTFRFGDDVYDRIWYPFNYEFWINISTPSTDSIADNLYKVPSAVLGTAVTPINNTDSLGFYWDPDNTTYDKYYLYLHFAETEELPSNQSREFNIFVNGKSWYGPFSPPYLSTYTVYSTGPEGPADRFNVWLNKTKTSTLPPLLNAMEIYKVKYFSDTQTDQKDVDAVTNIKSMYGVEKRSWVADPCAPRDFVWEGLNCTYTAHDPPRITGLNLSSSGLSGGIASYIANLTMLQYLDLSNNSLDGIVPDFLSQLPFLTILNLERNNLSGSIPVELIRRSENGSLTLRVDPYLCSTCQNNNSKKKKNIIIPVIASVGGFFVIAFVIAIAFVWRIFKRKELVTEPVPVSASKINANIAGNPEDRTLDPRKQWFTYSEVLDITNNFQHVIGKGGFGTVYHGYLGDTQVAVKRLSPSAINGYKQFQAEAQLLTRVHHRNLTSLVGYCDEGPNVALIYEYMANGNLANLLFDKDGYFLTWEERLRIAVDASQGLEYLHDGCKPPIIHRDIKCTNILLNENLQAKLADFGLSKVFPIEGDSSVWTTVAGTPGYLDPAYYESSRLNEKSDIYSFGIVLLEIMTGRLAISGQANNRLTKWVDFMVAKGDVRSIVDPKLEGNVDMNSLWKALEMAMACVSRSPKERPTMNQVSMELKQCLAMEMARTGGRPQTESKDSIELVSMNTYIHQNPLPR